MPRKIPVCPVADLPAGLARVVALSSGDEIAVFNVGGVHHAIDNRCPHQGAPLMRGTVQGGRVACPLHRLEFRLADGACPWSAVLRVRTYPVSVEHGWICIELPAVACT